MTRTRIALLIICSLALAGNVAFLIWSPQIEDFIVNARAGCWPWSPAAIEYYPGVKACPGQYIYGNTTIPDPLVIPNDNEGTNI